MLGRKWTSLKVSAVDQKICLLLTNADSAFPFCFVTIIKAVNHSLLDTVPIV